VAHDVGKDLALHETHKVSNHGDLNMACDARNVSQHTPSGYAENMLSKDTQCTPRGYTETCYPRTDNVEAAMSSGSGKSIWEKSHMPSSIQGTPSGYTGTCYPKQDKVNHATTSSGSMRNGVPPVCPCWGQTPRQPVQVCSHCIWTHPLTEVQHRLCLRNLHREPQVPPCLKSAVLSRTPLIPLSLLVTVGPFVSYVQPMMPVAKFMACYMQPVMSAKRPTVSHIWPTVPLTSHKTSASYPQLMVPVTVCECRVSLWPTMLTISHSIPKVGTPTHSAPLIGTLINGTRQVDTLTHSMSLMSP